MTSRNSTKKVFGFWPQKWPKNEAYRDRFFVPDLSPEHRPEQLKSLKTDVIFVAESPHEAEVRPEQVLDRRPLCGAAGRVWWKMVGELVAHDDRADTDLERLLELCRRGRLVVMNAVEFPLDPKITAYYGAVSDPIQGLGFSKVPPASYKKLRASSDVITAVEILRARLLHPSLAKVPVVSLGNDAQWFVSQALGAPVGTGRHLMTVPHPSAWWRQGGKLRDKAREQLTGLLVKEDRQRLRSAASDRA